MKKTDAPASKPKGRRLGTKGKINPMRLKVVAELMVQGIDYQSIQDELSERWNVTKRTIRAYRDRVLVEMRDHLKDEGFLDPGLEKILGMQRLDACYAKAFAAGDVRTCMHIVKTRLLIVGVLGPQKHEHTFPEGVPVVGSNMTDEQVAAEFEASARIAERERTRAAGRAAALAAGGAAAE